MGIADVAASAGGEYLKRFLPSESESSLSKKDVEDLEEERERLRLRIQSLEEEGLLSSRRLGYAVLGVAGAVLVFYLIFR